jgi:hypothetical protein
MKRLDLALVVAVTGFWLGSATPGLAEGALPPTSNSATPAATNAPSPAAPPPASNAAAPPATTAPSPTAPSTSSPPAASQSVVLYIDPEITKRKWSNAPMLFRPIFLADENLNDVGQNVHQRLSALVTSLSPGATVVDSPQPGSGARLYIVPTVKRLDQISGMFAWDDLSYVIELEWRVTDASGAVVLLETVKGEAKGKFGTSFTAAANAQRYEDEMFDQAMANSKALLKPVLAPDQAQASPPTPPKSPS